MSTPHTFWKSVASAVAVMIALIAFDFIPLSRNGNAALRAVELTRRTAKTRGLSAEARENATAGYYQELLNGASGVVTKTPARLDQFVGGRRVDTGAPRLEEMDANIAPVNDYRHDFLIYRPRPNLDLHDPRFKNVRELTNSRGLSDQEYPDVPAQGTWRIVLLGDSMARALGVEPGGGFEPRLETYLNDHDTTPTVRHFEILNMGVSGYRLTQIVDLALEEAPRYKPNSYVVVVSWLTVARKWGLHLAQLVDEGIDPKYDFLRQVVRDSGLKKGDSASTAEARLAPYMLPTFQWAMRQIKQKADAEGATMAVILTPHLKGIGSYEGDFGPVRAALAKEGIPVADLLDAFDGVDTATLDVGDGLHPNADGHRMLFELLYKRIKQDSKLSSVFRVPSTASSSE
jgi:lysophospholipase L1-like esterase